MGEDFEQELKLLINRHSKENDSGTPDHILAKYMSACLDAYSEAVQSRAAWHSQPVNLIGWNGQRLGKEVARMEESPEPAPSKEP